MFREGRTKETEILRAALDEILHVRHVPCSKQTSILYRVQELVADSSNQASASAILGSG